MIKKILQGIRWLFAVLANAGYKFYWDDCFSRASSLAYTTLFSLVPVAALIYGMFNGFNIEESQLERILLQILPPIENELMVNLKNQVLYYLNEFGQSARALGIISLPILVFSGIALINTIESALNGIWRVSSSTNMLSKIISFMSVIIFGPLIIASSFYWYSRFELLNANNRFMTAFAFTFAGMFVPTLTLWLALTLLYYKLPSARVTMRDAALGGFFSAIIYEFTKRGFAYYIGMSTTYSNFYGVLVTIPVFLFWLYLMWVVVLFGAQISYQAGSLEILSGLRKYASDLGEIGALLGIRILQIIGGRFQNGDVPATEGQIAIETGSDPVIVRSCLKLLSDAGLISVADEQTHSRILIIAPEKITIRSILKAFHSKRYRVKIEEGASDVIEAGALGVIQSIRRTAITLPIDKKVVDWTLADLLSE